MANLLQQARQRKIIYWGVIALLFTVALVHRKFVVTPLAFALQLRESARGQVELTSSAVRLMLTGSRGLAVTLLWYNAMDKQKRGEWNELELLVKSITKLQPYFITPWLYQSWNIAFNVAVECDRPRDKYYYVSRGLELLAEGERRNRGTGEETAGADDKRVVFPGHPELRHFMGFAYQLKIGTSDERLTMRSLLELSCIDPIERDADKRFLTRDALGRPAVNRKEFLEFCQKYPRLVRRLNQQLGMAQPLDIANFLKDHMDIPNRFKPAQAGQIRSELKDPLEQFPILPPALERHWPNPKSYELTSESLDVFLVCRTWYEFAQRPLPPPDPRPRGITQDYDKVKYRLSTKMVPQLFRKYPARAQVYIAETLESEGFFDSDGWNLRDNVLGFRRLELRDNEDSRVGTEPKYHSMLAWKKGFEMYEDYGIRNGIYLTPVEIRELNEKAKEFREKAFPNRVLKADEMPQVQMDWRGSMGESLEAHQRLYYSRYYRNLSNFNSFYFQAEGEKDPITATARKLMFRAEKQHKSNVVSGLVLRDYEAAFPLYMEACFRYPRFAQVASMQEDFTEVYQRYLGAVQKLSPNDFRQAALWAAKVPIGAPPDWLEILSRHEVVSEKEKDQQVLNSITPFKKRTGILDRVQFYNGPEPPMTNDPLFAGPEFREFLFLWTRGADLSHGYPATIPYPGHAYYLLTRVAPHSEDVPPHWAPLISEDSRRITANRLGLGP